MKTLSVKLPEALAEALRREARRAQVSQSELVRRMFSISTCGNASSSTSRPGREISPDVSTAVWDDLSSNRERTSPGSVLMPWLLDTGPLVAFFDRGDRLPRLGRGAVAACAVPLLTCEAVLAEATYLLQRHAGLNPARVLELIERGAVATAFRIEEHTGAVMRLLDKYADQEMQLADACLVRMSEIVRNSQVFTIDPSRFPGLPTIRASGDSTRRAARVVMVLSVVSIEREGEGDAGVPDRGSAGGRHRPGGGAGRAAGAGGGRAPLRDLLPLGGVPVGLRVLRARGTHDAGGRHRDPFRQRRDLSRRGGVPGSAGSRLPVGAADSDPPPLRAVHQSAPGALLFPE